MQNFQVKFNLVQENERHSCTLIGYNKLIMIFFALGTDTCLISLKQNILQCLQHLYGFCRSATYAYTHLPAKFYQEEVKVFRII